MCCDGAEIEKGIKTELQWIYNSVPKHVQHSPFIIHLVESQWCQSQTIEKAPFKSVSQHV